MTWRATIKASLCESGAKNVRVFDSVARGQETTLSDINMLVDLQDDTSPFALVTLRGEFERLLDAGVDLVPAISLKDDVRPDVNVEYGQALSRHDRQRLEDISDAISAISAIAAHLQRSDLSDGLVFDAVRFVSSRSARRSKHSQKTS